MSRLCILLMIAAAICGCHRGTEGTKVRRDLDHCLPQSSDTDGLSLAINDVTRVSDGTSVKLVAYAVDKSVQFDLPLYIMSAGRWLINDSGRTYLIDEECREYKLKDKKVSSGQKNVERGRVILKPGEAFEFTLLFTPVSSEITAGALVYGSHTLRFALSP